MGKNLDMIMLFDFYRNLLTDKQAEAVDLYYNEDLSLAEISEILSVTRQGVRDNIKRAEGIMLDAEQKLGVVSRFKKQQLAVGQARKIAADILKCNPDKDIAENVNKLDNILCEIEE